MLVLLMGGIYEVHLDMTSCGMIYIPSFIKIGTGLKEILKFCLGNFRGCVVGSRDGMDL
jgi:hypothetical protein